MENEPRRESVTGVTPLYGPASSNLQGNLNQPTPTALELQGERARIFASQLHCISSHLISSLTRQFIYPPDQLAEHFSNHQKEVSGYPENLFKVTHAILSLHQLLRDPIFNNLTEAPHEQLIEIVKKAVPLLESLEVANNQILRINLDVLDKIEKEFESQEEVRDRDSEQEEIDEETRYTIRSEEEDNDEDGDQLDQDEQPNSKQDDDGVIDIGELKFSVKSQASVIRQYIDSIRADRVLRGETDLNTAITDHIEIRPTMFGLNLSFEPNEHSPQTKISGPIFNHFFLQALAAIATVQSEVYQEISDIGWKNNFFFKSNIKDALSGYLVNEPVLYRSPIEIVLDEAGRIRVSVQNAEDALPNWRNHLEQFTNMVAQLNREANLFGIEATSDTSIVDSEKVKVELVLKFPMQPLAPDEPSSFEDACRIMQYVYDFANEPLWIKYRRLVQDESQQSKQTYTQFPFEEFYDLEKRATFAKIMPTLERILRDCPQFDFLSVGPHYCLPNISGLSICNMKREAFNNSPVCESLTDIRHLVIASDDQEVTAHAKVVGIEQSPEEEIAEVNTRIYGNSEVINDPEIIDLLIRTCKVATPINLDLDVSVAALPAAKKALTKVVEIAEAASQEDPQRKLYFHLRHHSVCKDFNESLPDVRFRIFDEHNNAIATGKRDFGQTELVSLQYNQRLVEEALERIVGTVAELATKNELRYPKLVKIFEELKVDIDNGFYEALVTVGDDFRKKNDSKKLEETVRANLEYRGIAQGKDGWLISISSEESDPPSPP